MKFSLSSTVVLSVMATTGVVASPSTLVGDLVSAARSSCEALEGGRFDTQSDYLVALDLDGDGQTDQLVDESHFGCSSSASLFTPNGGSMLHAVVNGAVYSWQVNAWRLVDWGENTVLLMAEHGTECGGYGYQPCFEAVVFSEGKPLSVRATASDNSTES